LQEPDWNTRREVLRALVKKVEIDEQEVRIVYRVSPSPFERGPQHGFSQRCWGRCFTLVGESLHALCLRSLDDPDLSGHPVRALCRRCDHSRQEPGSSGARARSGPATPQGVPS
jgi:hypothetical protein